MIPKVYIDIKSDYICPWCYLGKVRLERVKQELKGEIGLEITVLPHILYPAIPVGGAPKEAFAKKTKPGMGRSLRGEAQIENIEINYKNIKRLPRSYEAHRLTWLIPDNDVKYELAKKIFYAYFEKGNDIENHQLLTDLATKSGVSTEIIQQFLTSDAGTLEINNYLKNSEDKYITVVPSLKLNSEIVIPGLQPIENWLNYIRRASRMNQN